MSYQREIAVEKARRSHVRQRSAYVARGIVGRIHERLRIEARVLSGFGG